MKPTYIKLSYSCPHCQGDWFEITEKTEKHYKLNCLTCNQKVIGEFRENMEWKDIYVNRCEGGFYDQVDPETGNPAPELTVVKGFTAHWLHKGDGDFPRPELDMKKLPQPEVYEGRFSAGGFYLSSTGRFGFVSDRIYVTPGEKLRASVMYMHVFNGNKVGGGSRAGIVMGDGPFGSAQTVWPKNEDPFNDGAIVWGGWRGTYVGDTPNREWVKLETPETMGGIDYVRIVVQFNADVAAAGSHGHWDVFKLQAFTSSSPDIPDDPQPDDPPPDNNDGSILFAIQGMRQELSRAKDAILQAIDATVKTTDCITFER